MDRENLWTRRSNASRQSSDLTGKSDSHSRPTAKQRYSSGAGGSNGIPPLNTNAASSSTGPSRSSAFGLGSGAFASFGSAAKTPKTPGNAFDFTKTSSNSSSATESENKNAKGAAKLSTSGSTKDALKGKVGKPNETKPALPLKHSWIVWYRPPTAKNVDYEKSIRPLFKISTVQEFWRVYSHLKHPSALPQVSDYHFFRDGVRPVWEDEENRRGGKWILRLKKGVIDRYWDDLLLTAIGDQFAEAGEEVCGMVVSVRSGEDVLSIWTKYDNGRNVKIRETIKRELNLPGDTIIVWKSHDDSISQRAAIDQARQEKGAEKRRNTLGENAHQVQGSREK